MKKFYNFFRIKNESINIKLLYSLAKFRNTFININNPPMLNSSIPIYSAETKVLLVDILLKEIFWASLTFVK